MDKLLVDFNIEQNKIYDKAIAKLYNNAKANDLKKEIQNIKNQIFEIFTMYRENEEFKEFHFVLENGNAKKNYEFRLQLENFSNIEIVDILKLDKVGLSFNKEEMLITGTPLLAGNFNIEIDFFNKKDLNKTVDKKYVTLIVNADPKDLWKNIPSDSGALYYKPDSDSYYGEFSDRKIVIASNRGRSHAHEGTFRDDDFFVKLLPDNWNIVAVADGAGSAKFARKGSQIATESICDFFNNEDLIHSLNDNIKLYHNDEILLEENTESNGIDNKLGYKKNIIQTLYSGVKSVYEELSIFSIQENMNIKDLNSTLIFVLLKKFDFGYAILSFGVGDCPINIIDNNSVKLLNILDVGEFGGGTRFITMNEVFSNPNMASRFGVNIYQDFSKLFLMTDGIYDPKFITENRLEDINAWQEFLKDLDGENDENLKVGFTNDVEVKSQLLNWMDFWSKGNHDDRTLAIIY